MVGYTVLIIKKFFVFFFRLIYSLEDSSVELRKASNEDRIVFADSLARGYRYDDIIQKYREYFVIIGPKNMLLGRVCFQRRVWNNERLAILYSLYVHPSLRGYGWSKKLVVEVVQMATKEGYEHLILFVLKKNIIAISLYENFGFHTVRFEELSEVYQQTFSGVVVEENIFYKLDLSNKL